MKFQCPKCDVAYQVADERLVAGMRLRCKRCETVFALEEAKPIGQERSALLASAALGSGSLAPRRPVSISVKDESTDAGPRSGRPHLFAVPSVAERPRSEAAEAEPAASSWRNPEPPPSLSPGRLSAPRVPSFGSSAPGAAAGSADSLAPGASVWPDKSPARSARQVPLLVAIGASATALVVGLLGGFLGSDLLASEPLSVARASLPVSFVGVKGMETPEAAVKPGPSDSGPVVPPSPPPSAAPDAVRSESSKSTHSKGPSAGTATPKAKAAEAFPLPDMGDGKSSEAEAPASELALGDRLTGAEIQRTVYRYQPSVRHSCWQRQLANRDPSAPSTAKVTVTMTIAPTGKVTKASTSGEAVGYPGLSACISDKVKSWTFPQALGSTTAQVPFTFAAQ